MFKRGVYGFCTALVDFFSCKDRLASTSKKFFVMKSSLHTESSSSVISKLFNSSRLSVSYRSSNEDTTFVITSVYISLKC